jgi:hypothetical protein
MQPDPMDWLFGEIYGLFGNLFLDKFRSGHIVDGIDTGIKNMKATWAERIRENSLMLSDVKRGLKGCERSKFPPSWPEFLELCRPTPNVDEALVEAVQQLQARQDGKDEWTHPAIYWAAMRIGYFDMTKLTHSVLKPRFEDALKRVLSEPVKPVPPKFAELPAPKAEQVELDLAERKKRLQALRFNCLAKPSDEPSPDRLAWARKILERDKNGDRNISLLQVNEARQALGIRRA